MATIPLYNDGQMPRVREVEGLSLVPRAEYRGDYAGLADAAARAHTQPLMPAEMFSGKMEVAEAWAGAAKSVGGLVSGLAEKVMKVQDAGAMADGEKLMRDSFAEYQGGLDPSSDVASRLGGWQKQSQALAKQILGSGRLSSKAKESMQLRMERFNSEAVIHLSADASKQAVTQARASFSALEQAAVKQGDYDVALTANDGATDAELQSRQAGEARRAQLMRARQKQELYAFIEENPRVARDLFEQEGTLGYYDLTPWGREEGGKVARATFARHEYGAVRGLKESLAADDVRDVGGLDAYALDLDDDTTGQWVAYVNGERDMDDPVDYEQAHLEVGRYNAQLDPYGEKLAKLQTSLATRFNGGYEERLLRSLDGQAERTRAMGTNAMDDELTGIQQQITQALGTGIFGEWTVPGAELEWDAKSNAWMRAGGNGGVPSPIRLARSQQMMLAKNQQKGWATGDAEPLLDDMDAKEAAALVAGNIRASVAMGMREGRYATPAAMREEFGALMHPHVVRSLRKLLPTYGANMA
jgi:hypothetical protein